ncbi:diamine acetyltransferase [Basidiobolus meristosporus CBS 931.73]|uniref:Diamine acetyltransferase n=1 Tax=Basidiobolus meristosporus CBS 931.73 TaxID=1314790 RepID=A0A1Y1Z8N4_9FUNG|nr:diamine acetyltransferase [Basidiobolus meristosporus CBS 931.73]|eukprot:ORY06175.1 diamine acetyltransferase [Basidiobolus meristosporus CBS 931.73]
MSEVLIRDTTRADVPIIFRMIKDLARYEKLESEVVSTEEEMGEALFGGSCQSTTQVVFAYVNTPEGDEKVVGFALFFHNFSTFLGKHGIYLEDLYVVEEYRSKGVGTKLLKFLAKRAVSNSFGRVDWWVLNWNKNAIGFYEKIGAVPMDEWTTYRLTGDALKKFAEE